VEIRARAYDGSAQRRAEVSGRTPERVGRRGWTGSGGGPATTEQDGSGRVIEGRGALAAARRGAADHSGACATGRASRYALDSAGVVDRTRSCGNDGRDRERGRPQAAGSCRTAASSPRWTRSTKTSRLDHDPGLPRRFRARAAIPGREQLPRPEAVRWRRCGQRQRRSRGRTAHEGPRACAWTGREGRHLPSSSCRR